MIVDVVRSCYHAILSSRTQALRCRQSAVVFRLGKPHIVGDGSDTVFGLHVVFHERPVAVEGPDVVFYIVSRAVDLDRVTVGQRVTVLRQVQIKGLVACDHLPIGPLIPVIRILRLILDHVGDHAVRIADLTAVAEGQGVCCHRGAVQLVDTAAGEAGCRGQGDALIHIDRGNAFGKNDLHLVDLLLGPVQAQGGLGQVNISGRTARFSLRVISGGLAAEPVLVVPEIIAVDHVLAVGRGIGH